MGLMDILNGMQNGPRGQRDPSTSGGGGMSPVTMAIVGLLAYKAIKSFSGSGQPSTSAADPAATPSDSGGLGGLLGGGGLGGLLGGGLGGLLGGNSGGNVLSSGLNDVVTQLQQSGHGETANSWIGGGPNKSISPNDLAAALGDDKIDTLSQQTGLSRDDLLQALSEHLPQVVDELTPNGRLPTEHEASHLISQ